MISLNWMGLQNVRVVSLKRFSSSLLLASVAIFCLSSPSPLLPGRGGGLGGEVIRAWTAPSSSLFYREHCLFIKDGYLKAESARPEEMLQNYEREAPGKTLVIHFHGGLVSESSAKKEATDLTNSCYGAVSYPIFFAWNADFFSELGNLIEAKYHNIAFSQGGMSTSSFLEGLYQTAHENHWDAEHIKAAYTEFMKNEAQFQRAVSKQAKKEVDEDILASGRNWSDWLEADTWKKAKDRIQKKVVTYFSPYVMAAMRYHDSKSVSWGGDFLEWISTNFGGRQIWSTMKQDTALSFSVRNGVPGAGLMFLQALARHHVPRIVLVGHSTGCIYILNFLKAAKAIMPTTRFDVVFLAPANTYGDTARFLASNASTIRNFRMFGIRDLSERHDHMLWQINPQLEGIYPGSLLIYVARAVETRHNIPILGLERDFATPSSEPDRSNNLLVKRFLFSRAGSTVWAPANGPVGLCSNCVSHGNFCSDSKTLASLRFLVRDQDW